MQAIGVDDEFNIVKIYDLHKSPNKKYKKMVTVIHFGDEVPLEIKPSEIDHYERAFDRAYLYLRISAKRVIPLLVKESVEHLHRIKYGH